MAVYIFKKPITPIRCVDGFTVSVQASELHYSTPRSNIGPYSHVELGFPSKNPPYYIERMAEDPKNPRKTVYGWVPISLVVDMIQLHGGIADGPEEVNFGEGVTRSSAPPSVVAQSDICLSRHGEEGVRVFLQLQKLLSESKNFYVSS